MGPQAGGSAQQPACLPTSSRTYTGSVRSALRRRLRRRTSSASTAAMAAAATPPTTPPTIAPALLLLPLPPPPSVLAPVGVRAVPLPSEGPAAGGGAAALAASAGLHVGSCTSSRQATPPLASHNLRITCKPGMLPACAIGEWRAGQGHARVRCVQARECACACMQRAGRSHPNRCAGRVKTKAPLAAVHTPKLAAQQSHLPEPKVGASRAAQALVARPHKHGLQRRQQAPRGRHRPGEVVAILQGSRGQERSKVCKFCRQ